MNWRLCIASAAWALAAWACNDPDRDLPPRYREVAVPQERLASAAAQQRGRGLYLANCALCHGENADGQGRRRILSSRPADFTSQTWRRTVTPRKVRFVLREGIHGTAMPAWPALTEDETWDLVAYVLSVSEKGAWPASFTPATPLRLQAREFIRELDRRSPDLEHGARAVQS